MFNSFMEQQQKLYQDFAQNVFGNNPYTEGLTKVYSSMVDMAKKAQEPWAEAQNSWAKMNPMASFFNQEAFTNPWANFFNQQGNGTNPFAAFFPTPEDFTKFYTNSFPGYDTFTKLFTFWKGMENPNEFLRNYSDQYMRLMETVMNGVFPAGTQAFVVKPKELMDTCVIFYNSVMAPWMEIDQALIERIAKGDTRAYVELFREINKKYDETFAKVFNMAGLGLNREKYEKQMKVMNLSYKQMFVTAELMSMVYDTVLSTLKVLMDEYQNLLKESKGAVTFKDFYDLWYKVNENALTDMLNTDEFSKAFGELGDVSGQYVQATNAVYEDLLSSLPIPTKTDMDSLYKTVYNLRKEVRDLKKNAK